MKITAYATADGSQAPETHINKMLRATPVDNRGTPVAECDTVPGTAPAIQAPKFA